MIEKLTKLAAKREKYVVGLMSGTSVDGIDAALVRISGSGTDTALEEIVFENYPWPDDVRKRIFALFDADSSSSSDVCHMNFLLGEFFADAAFGVAKEAGLGIDEIDLIGSHGQTIYHIPEAIDSDYPILSTLQIGEGAVIAHKTGTIVVTDFRAADMAAGGVGAPLVPYVDYVLYGGGNQTIALQNIGGIGNITVIPQNGTADDVIAFDTGPGNMIIDYVMKKLRGQNYDPSGGFAATGTVCNDLLSSLMSDKFFTIKPPKATGREYFGRDFCEELLRYVKKTELVDEDILATITAFTAESIAYSIEKFVPYDINKLIVSGGGAYNCTLMAMIKNRLPRIMVSTQEEEGSNSDSKEAVAFAILANETICGNAGNLPQVTGAKSRKILGKISI